MDIKKVCISKASDDDLSHVIDLHNKIYPGDSFGGFVLSYVLVGGSTYIATANKNIIGYICVHPMVTSQVNKSVGKFLQTLNATNITNIKNNQTNDEQKSNDSNPFFIVPLVGIIPEYKSVLPKLINKAIKYSMKGTFFQSKYILVFVRKNDIEIQDIYMEKGFLFANCEESGMFDGPKDDGLLMYKKVNIINKILSK